MHDASNTVYSSGRSSHCINLAVLGRKGIKSLSYLHYIMRLYQNTLAIGNKVYTKTVLGHLGLGLGLDTSTA